MSKHCMTLSSITVMFSASPSWNATVSSTTSMEGQDSCTIPSIGGAPAVTGWTTVLRT